MSPVAKIKERSKSSEFERIELLFLTPGTHVVRLLPHDVETIYTHFIMGKYSVACLGEDCPICQNNRKIILENPKKFREVSGWSSKTTRYVYTVLDRSMVKVCPECGQNEKMVNGVYPSQCSKCETILTGVKPVRGNTVKLFPASETLAISLNSVNDTVTGADGNPIGLENYDVVFNVVGTKQDKKITPIPNTSANDVVEYDSTKVQNPKNAVLQLNAGELNDLLRGVSLKDIFASRKKSVVEETTMTKTVVAEDVANSINTSVGKLFG